MVNSNNVRMTFTFSKKQAEWIRRCAKKCNLQPSQFIKWLIDKNIGRFFARMSWKDRDIIETLSLDHDTEEINGGLEKRSEISKEEWEHIFDGFEEPKKEENEDEIPF